MDWLPVASEAATPPPAHLPIEDTRVSSQEIGLTFAGNLGLGSIFKGAIQANEVGYWLDAMAYSDRYERESGPHGVILGNRFGYGLRVMFRVKQLNSKASLNYWLIGASLDAGFAQASYEINAVGFGSHANQALATILDGVASSGASLTGDTFYQLNSSILKNLVAYIKDNQATMQPVRVASLITTLPGGSSLTTSHAVLYAMREIREGKTLQEALNSAGDFDSTAIRLAYAKIMVNVSPTSTPTDANRRDADRWLADN